MSSVSQVYKRTEVIGRGKFGIVYKGIHRTTRKVYAIKVLNLDTSEDEVKDVQQEIQFLSNLKYVPNVTHYYGSYLNGTKLWIIMDYCAGGSLRTLLKPGRLEEKYIGVIVREVLIALQFIHKQNVIHRDIKAANVLIANEGKVQLCDFGVAAQLTTTSSRRNTMAGTPYWMAPEVILEGTSYDVKADIWSLGITIYEIATGNPPYCDKEAMRAMQLITKSKPPRLDGKQYSPLLKEVIALCLDENPQERLGAEELLKCKFVKFHKNTPTSALKEIISRYLLWREKKSSRESILMNVEEDGEENEVEVKWDFDSLSSNEYILENDININNINLNDNSGHDNEYTFETGDYDDGVDEFMTGYHNRGHYDHVPYGTTINNNTKNHTSNITYNKNTATYNVPSTLKANGTMNRKEAPKSLLQLFQEGSGEEDEGEEENNNTEDHYELPKISSSIGLSSFPTSSEISTPRVSTPIKQIEIPNFDDIETVPSQTQSQADLNPRSRANTLIHTQSTTALETRKTIDASLQRRPTLVSSGTTTSALPVQLQPQQHQLAQAANIIQNHSMPPNIPRGTPSPKRDLTILTSPSRLNPSPQKNSAGIASATCTVSMKAIPSPSNQLPLLQPLNAGTSQAPAPAASQTKPLQPQQQSVKRNYQNLRLQMPTPTSTGFPKLLHTTSNSEENDENINQFGVNVSNASNIPMAMTPLTEKPQTVPPQGNSTITVPKRKHTMTSMSQPPSMPFINNSQRTVSSVSSHSSLEGANNTANTSYTVEPRIMVPGVDVSLFIDGEYSKEKMNAEIGTLLGGFTQVLDLMEEMLNALNE